MASWVVFQPPQTGRATEQDPVFVRDGFSWLAFLFSPLWLLWHRLWVEAVAVFAALLAASALERVQGLGLAASLAGVLIAIFIGLEGNGMRIAAFRRRGWRFWGAVDADSELDAEARYAAEAEPDDAAERQPIAPSINPARAGTAPGAPVELLLNPGR
ncbi:DUF2628 domain-containing protein [Mesorhizobium sp. BAC0120]|uniref:DUF2628 domain-containing protein n=1 Tax=Mesorhizobium sp. BAC0120 TaxID=3090670 RepID=UPI00298C3EC9|nr:DUF2628 domain-containing protein [Mesorhizobium sp. BAC0120]MDW6024508.1 DUF2628 domain-containing protein [Mesorhizobium sp. BAC0120]